jgi:outer membrane protein assembly factor BamA
VTVAIAAALLLAPLAAPRAQTPEPAAAVADVRIHGNHTTPDYEVLRLAGIAVGDPAPPDIDASVKERLDRSGRFDRVDVRKRYRSLDMTGDVALIILVVEHPGVESVAGDMPNPLRRTLGSAMLLPILDYTDGYGFTYGVRATYANPFPHSRLSFPLTLGGTKQAAVEIETRIPRGPVSRIEATAAIRARDNPHFDLSDRRSTLGVRAERTLTSAVRLGASGGWTDVSFGDADARFPSFGFDATLDTRRDPDLPWNAVYVRAEWLRQNFPQAAVGRWRLDGRGFVGLFRGIVLAVRAVRDIPDGALPPYEQPLLGGAGSLRGYRAGFAAGDNVAAASAELRIPLTSPVSFGRAGLSVFIDTGAVYPHGTPLENAAFARGYGAGVFFSAAVFKLNVEVARRDIGGGRVHVSSGFRF